MTCQKSFCAAGAILLQRFQKMCCIFRGRRSILDTSDLILRGRRSTPDVSCCVFFANRIVSAARMLRLFCESNCQRCAKWWQGANSVAGVAFCDRWWKSTEASHETSILRSVRKKTRRKTSILKLQSVKVAVPMGKVAKTCLFRRVRGCAHVVLRGRRGTLWHSTLYTSHSTLCTPDSLLHTSHSTLYTPLYTPHSTLHIFRSTLETLHFTPHYTL